MIPLRDHNPTYGKVFVVPVLVAINVAVFLFIQPTFANGDPGERLLEQTRFFACNAAIPYEVMKGERVGDAFDAEPPIRDERELLIYVQERGCPQKNVWLSIFQSMFLHGGWLHIAGNMLFLWVFGNNIEDRLGHVKFVLFYLIAGVAATYAQSAFSADSITPMIGASGAVAGILGAYLVMFPRARVTTLVIFFFITAIELPAVVVLGLWFVLQVFQQLGSVAGAASGVAYLAHIGGFITGMLLLLVFRPRIMRERRAGPFVDPYDPY